MVPTLRLKLSTKLYEIQRSETHQKRPSASHAPSLNRSVPSSLSFVYFSGIVKPLSPSSGVDIRLTGEGVAIVGFVASGNSARWVVCVPMN